MKAAEQIIDSLMNEPDKWVQNENTLDHKEKNWRIWTANGFIFLGLWSPRIPFDLMTKVRINRAIKHWRNNLTI